MQLLCEVSKVVKISKASLPLSVRRVILIFFIKPHIYKSSEIGLDNTNIKHLFKDNSHINLHIKLALSFETLRMIL